MINIAQSAPKHLPEEFQHLPALALQVRQGISKLTIDDAFKNIALFTKVLEKELK